MELYLNVIQKLFPTGSAICYAIAERKSVFLLCLPVCIVRNVRCAHEPVELALISSQPLACWPLAILYC